jgi:UDP-N-acetylmuramate--alanine ligase
VNILDKYKKIHFIGIGGIGMSAIASVLNEMGKTISGSDLGVNKNTEILSQKDIQCFIGHSAQNIDKSIDCIVVTSAIKPFNAELLKAQDLNIPVLKRAQMLALISNDKNAVAVAGSHGKTTTSCYLSELLLKLELNPSFIVGGVLKNTGTNARLGSDYFVLEADESDSSFHYLVNEYSIITNIDDDHVDFYGNFDNLKLAFEKFININSKNVILNYDDSVIKELNITNPNVISFGQNDSSDYVFNILKMEHGESEFILKSEGLEHKFKTNITGDYNISNLVSAIIYALEKKIDIVQIQKNVIQIDGIKRRYDILLKEENRVIIDDYAHHPTEIEKLIKAIKTDYFDYSLKVFFEPHRFTRTKNFWNDFVNCFELVDELNLLPIYPASEESIPGVTSLNLFKDIAINNKNYIDSLNQIKELIKTKNTKKEIVLCLGAGPISSVFREVLDVEGV